MEKVMALPKKALAGVFAVAVVCALAACAGIAGATPSASVDSPNSATPGAVNVSASAQAAGTTAADYVVSPATGVEL